MIRNHHEPVGASAIVFIPKSWDEEFPEPITAIRITNCEEIDIHNAYGTECLANTVALAISSHRRQQEQVHTDCKSLVDSIPALLMRLAKAKSEYAILMASMHKSIQTTPPPVWIRSHPLVSNKPNWSRRQWGNHIADRVAAGQQRELTTPVEDNVYTRSLESRPNTKSRLLTIDTHVMSAKEVLPLLIPPNTWYWGTSNGTPLGVQNIKHYLHQKDLVTYTTTRDEYRAQNVDKTNPLATPPPPYWKSNTLEWAAKVANRGKRTVTEMAHSQRIILDWTHHGRNAQKTQRKRVSLTTSRRIAHTVRLMMTRNNTYSANVCTRPYGKSGMKL